MEINKQIRKYRSELNLSQEELAEKIFVTRQSVSNWETGKTYPDINSLILLSSLFGVSLDILIKGDLEKMKEEIKKQELNTEDMQKWNRNGVIFTILLLTTILTAVPLGYFLGWAGLAVWAVLAGITLIFAQHIEKQKKAYNIHTYKEILAFTEGRTLTEAEHNQEIGKLPYQKGLSVLVSGTVALIVSLLTAFLLMHFFPL